MNDSLDSAAVKTVSARNSWFVRFAQGVSRFTGRPLTFMVSVAVIIIWAITGPLFDYSDTWQLVINTGTTIITFLMVFVIQNTQNRDTAAMHIKIDELIRVSENARNILLDLEELDDKELEQIRKEYECLADEDEERRDHVATTDASEQVQKKAPPRRKRKRAAA